MTVASQVKQALAGLKGVQGTLRIYSAQERDGEAGKMLKDALMTTEEIMKDLEERVQILEFQEPQNKGS